MIVDPTWRFDRILERSSVDLCDLGTDKGLRNGTIGEG